MNGTLRYKFGSLGTGSYQFNNPTDVYVAPNGYLYVVDYNNQRVMVYDSGWNYVTMLGQTGVVGVGAYFNYPTSVAVSSSYVYVADTFNHRIAVFTVSGYSYEQDIGVAGESASSTDDTTHLNAPRGVSFEGSSVWISDTGMKRAVKTQGYYPSNISLDSCLDDNVDWQGSGTLSGTTSATLSPSDINSFLTSCTYDDNDLCTFNIRVSSDSPGYIALKNLNLVYDVIPISTLNGSNSGFDYYLSIVEDGVHVSGSPFHIAPGYDIDIPQGTYNFTLAVDAASYTLGHVFHFFNVQLLQNNYYNQIMLDNPPTIAFDLPDRVPLLLSCVSLGSMSYDYSTLVFSWSSVSPTLISDEENLTLYKCSTWDFACLLYTSPSPRDLSTSSMPSSA